MRSVFSVLAAFAIAGHSDQSATLLDIPGTCCLHLGSPEGVYLTNDPQSELFDKAVDFFYQSIRECTMLGASAVALAREDPLILGMLYERVRKQINHLVMKPIDTIEFQLSAEGIAIYVAPLVDRMTVMYIDEHVHGIDPTTTSSH